MKLLCLIVGNGWALLGAANIVMMPWLGQNTDLLATGILVNVILYIIPGLILGGIGKS